MSELLVHSPFYHKYLEVSRRERFRHEPCGPGPIATNFKGGKNIINIKYIKIKIGINTFFGILENTLCLFRTHSENSVLCVYQFYRVQFRIHCGPCGNA